MKKRIIKDEINTPIQYLFDKETEKAVLGTLLLQKNALGEIRELLSPDSFYINFHKSVYEAIISITEKGERADIVTVMPELTKMGIDFKPYEIADMASHETFSISQYACRLNELEKKRRLVNIGQFLVSSASSEIEDVEDILTSVNDRLSAIFGETTNHVTTANDHLEELYNHVNDNINGVNTMGTPTGFLEIDSRGGLQPTNLIICAAESSQGKTAFANAVLMAASKAGENVAVYSMEMSGMQLITRLTAMESNIPVATLTNEKLNDTQLRDFDKALGRLSGLGIYFDDRSTSNIENILASIRSLRIKYNISGAIIDYLQILNVNKKSDNNEEALADAARRLKNIAKDLNIWIIALSQLNRDSQAPFPTINRLRGSGQINEASDITIMIFRPEVYGTSKKYPDPFSNTDTKGTAMIDVAKGRNIGTFKFIVGFDAATTKFYNLEQRPILISENIDKPF